MVVVAPYEGVDLVDEFLDVGEETSADGLVLMPNQRSTWLIHEAYVGV